MNTITLRIGMSLAEAEKEILIATLKLHDWDKRKTASTLGVSLKTVYNMVNKYDIRPPGYVYRQPTHYHYGRASR